MVLIIDSFLRNGFSNFAREIIFSFSVQRVLKSTYWSDGWIVGLVSDVSELENLALLRL
jgi:hypothetical protein